MTAQNRKILKEKALAGYAGIVGNVLYPLNENKQFKRLFKHKNLKILMNSPFWVYAELVIIEKGTIRVDGIKNKTIDIIKKDVLKWNVYLEMNIVLFSTILAKRKSLFIQGEVFSVLPAF
jgi:hypothetical protein